MSMYKWTVGAATVAPLAACLLATAALAETKPAQPQAPPAARNDKVCETITVTGSRLGTKRFCGTRAEWEERKRRDREAVEAAQRSPCVITTTGASGKPSC